MSLTSARPLPPSTTRVTVRFHEADPYGHVNHACYVHYLEFARSEILRGQESGLAELQNEDVTLLVADLQIRYLRPAFAGDVLDIESWLTELRPASSVWRQRVLRNGEELCTAHVRLATATCTGRPRRTPARLQRALRGLTHDPVLPLH